MKRPRIKLRHWPVRLPGGQVRIGGTIPGIGHKIDDPDGWVWALVGLLDGSRTMAQVVAGLRRSFPGRPAHDVPLAIGQLIAAGHIEDADDPEPAELTSPERERYSRSRALFQWTGRGPHRTSWDEQIALKQAGVAVLGLGGVGSMAALALVASGVGRIHCVDRDVVELSNLNRQTLFTEKDLGTPKTAAAVLRLRERNSGVLITGEQRDIDGVDAVKTFTSTVWTP